MTRSLRRILTLLLCTALLLTASACSIVRKPQLTPAPTAAVTPEPSAAPVIAMTPALPESAPAPLLGGLTVPEYDPDAFQDTLNKLSSALDGDDSTVVLQCYDAVVEQVGIFNDALSMATLEYYMEPYNKVKEARYSELEKATAQFFNDYSLAVSAALNSDHAEALTAHIENPKTLDLKDYEGMDEELKALYDRESELELLYDSYYTSIYDLETQAGGETWTWNRFIDEYAEMEYDHYYQVYCALSENENRLMGGTLLQLVEVRNQIAVLSGYDNYYEMAWTENFGRDYQYDDFLTVRDMYLEHMTEVSAGLEAASYASCYSGGDGVDWDMTDFFQRLSDCGFLTDDMRQAAAFMDENGLLALGDGYSYDSSYTSYLYTADAPFIYHSVYDAMYDVICMAHETGHAINCYYDTLNAIDGGYPSIDVCEIHSNGFELIAMEALADMYPELADELRIMLIKDVVGVIPTASAQAEIEHMLYTTDELTLEEVHRAAAEIMNSYGLSTDIPDISYTWCEVPHYSFSAGYVVSYVTSAAAALALWMQYNEAPETTLQKFDDLLKLDARANFMQTVEDFGLTGIFSGELYKRLANYINENYLAY